MVWVPGTARAHLAGFHRAARDEHDRNVQAHRGHQHAGVILSQFEMQTSASAQCGVDHVLDRVGDDVAAGQRIQHAVVAHRDAVVDRDGVEFMATPPAASISRATSWPRSFRWTWPRHELREAVGDRDDGFSGSRILHAGGAHSERRPPCCGQRWRSGTVDGHGDVLLRRVRRPVLPLLPCRAGWLWKSGLSPRRRPVGADRGCCRSAGSQPG